MNVSTTHTPGAAIKYKLREPMTTEELYALLAQRWTAQLPGSFQLKKGFLFGPYIKFDTYLQMQPRIKVKDGVVKISRVEVQTQTGGIDLKAASQAIKTLKNGGNMMDVALGGPEYFLRVCAEVEKILGDKIVQ